MIFGLPLLALFAATIYFAIIGVKVTVERHQDALVFIRDILKYAALFLAVLFLSFGLAGLLVHFIDPNNFASFSEEDTARWLSFVFVGIPVVAIISRWIKRDFTKDVTRSHDPAWQLYLLASTTFSFAIWFLFLSGSLTWLAGEPFNPKGLAQGVISFLVWLAHIRLLHIHTSLMANIHRFIGWFAGVTGLLVAAISLFSVAINKLVGYEYGKFTIQEAIILAAVAAPTAVYYKGTFESYGSEVQVRLARTFAGQAVPALFATIAATFTLNALITWITGSYTNWAEVPSTTATFLVLFAVIRYFRLLTKNFERDQITQIFQYLISGLSMIALAISVGALIASSLDRTDSFDGFIFGLSLLITTFPTWFLTWRKCQFAINLEFESEHSSPVRRFYLYAMIGIPTIVALGSSVWVLFSLFKSLLMGNVDTLEISSPLGVLISTALVALYHLRIQRKEFS